MALRWNELDDALDSQPCTPTHSASQERTRKHRYGNEPGTDGWEVSGADETDCTQDDGDVSAAGEEFHLPPLSLFTGQHRPARKEHTPARNKLDIDSTLAHARMSPVGSTSARATGEWKSQLRPSAHLPTFGQGLRCAGDLAEPVETHGEIERELIRERGAAGRRASETRQRGVAGDDATGRRRRGSAYKAEGNDDLIEGVWGLGWGSQSAWATALESSIGRRLQAFGQRARGGIFSRCRDEKQGAAEKVAGTSAAERQKEPYKIRSLFSSSPASLRGIATPEQDVDADGDVSECEALRHTTPSDAKTEPRARSDRSVGEHVRHVAVRAKEIAATLGERWQRKRRHARTQRHLRPDRMILLPGGNIRRAWDCIGLVLLLLLLLVQVVNERWKSQHKGWMFFDVEQPYTAMMLKIQVLLDVFFIVDIFVNFRTAYCDEKTGQYVKDAWRIADHYSRHWLLCDLFCAIPLDLLMAERPVVVREAQRKKGKTWLKWLVRRTGALRVLRVAASTRPFLGARRVGKFMVHGRRAMRAFGGVLRTLRGMQSMKHVLSLRSALKGWAVMRDMGVFRIFSNASVAARTLAGSFTFLRLLVSSLIRGWEEGFNAIRSARSYVWSLVQGEDEKQSAKAQTEASQGRKTRKLSPKYQARGRNPLASPLASLLRNASKSTPRFFRTSDKGPGRGQAPRRLLYDHDEISDYELTPLLQRSLRPSSVETPTSPCDWPETQWSVSRVFRTTPSHGLTLMSLDLALSPAQEQEQESFVMSSVPEPAGGLWQGINILQADARRTDGIGQVLACMHAYAPSAYPPSASTEESCRETEYARGDSDREDDSPDDSPFFDTQRVGLASELGEKHAPAHIEQHDAKTGDETCTCSSVEVEERLDIEGIDQESLDIDGKWYHDGQVSSCSILPAPATRLLVC